MKKSLYYLLLSFLLCSCSNTPLEEEITPYLGEIENTMFVTSDIHLLASSLVDNTVKYSKDNLITDGRVQEYDYEIITTLINQVNMDKPSYFIITGDLTFNGELESHQEVVSLLNLVNEDTKVLVIPGNHDIYNLNASSYVNDEKKETSYINENQFKEMYKQYGYSDALNYDENTLSYFYRLDNETYGLFIDSTLSRYNEENGMNIIGGYLYDDTLAWIESNLKMAQEQGKKVISFMHHNLITHHEKFKNLYTLSNAETLKELFVNYDVQINFSGHMHIQSIKEETIDEKVIYDICNSSPLDYGNRYGVLTRYTNGFSYSSLKINVNIEQFEEYSFDTFYSKYYNKYINSFKEKYPSNYKKLLDFCSKINCYYFDGNYLKINELCKENKSLVRFINSSKFESEYLKIICNVVAKNQYTMYLQFGILYTICDE
ncbi:MAG: metallophosphoesterase family protein [Bacilli bacterium]